MEYSGIIGLSPYTSSQNTLNFMESLIEIGLIDNNIVSIYQNN